MRLQITDEFLQDPELRVWIRDLLFSKGVEVKRGDITGASDSIITKLIALSLDTEITLWSPEQLWADVKDILIPDNGDWPDPLINRGTTEVPDWQRKKIWEYFHIIRSTDGLRCIIKYNVNIQGLVIKKGKAVRYHFGGYANAEQLGKLISFFVGWQSDAWKGQWIATNITPA